MYYKFYQHHKCAKLFLASMALAIVSLNFTTSNIALAKESIDIFTAMNLAEQYAIASKVANATVSEMESKKWQTIGQMLPSVSLESTQVWLSSDVNKLVGKTISGQLIPDRVNTAAIVVGQPITPLWPLYLKLQSDFENAHVAIVDKEQNKRNAKFLGAELFIKSQKAEQFLTIAEASLALVEKQKNDAEALARAGKITSVDLLRLDMALADARTQVAQARNIRALGLLALAETINIKDYENIKLVSTGAALFGGIETPTPNRDNLLAMAQTNRSEILAANARVNMAELFKLGNKADYFPTIVLFTKYERDFQKKDMAVQDFGAIIQSISTRRPMPASTIIPKNDIRDTLSFGLSLKWSIWDWGIRWFRASEMEAGIQKAKYGKEQIESGVRIETTQAYLDIEYAKISLSTNQTSVKFAEEAYKQQNARFLNGAATVTEIITAERDQTRARGGLSNAVGDLDLSWLKLYKTTGQDPLLSVKK